MPCRPAPLLAAGCLGLAGTTAATAGRPGDGPLDPFTIESLPFTDTQDTGSFTDGFDLVCPFSGSTSSDVWYAYTTTDAGLLSVDVCFSEYDTKLYVLDGQLGEIACVDDSCSPPGGGPFRSNLVLNLPAGLEVFIVVDGYGGENGVFNLVVEATVAPEISCPDRAIAEGEVNEDGLCDPAVDTNGGCNSTLEGIFTDVACGNVICGIAWAAGGTRDTDWYRLPAHDEPTLVRLDAVGEFPGAYYLLGENLSCGDDGILAFADPDPLERATLSWVVSGETWWFAAVNGFELVPCGASAPYGNHYVIGFSCTTDIPPDPCPALGDLDASGFVDFDDLLGLLAGWGTCP